MKFEKLLSPGKMGSLELKNRFVVPPMGTNLGTYEGYVTENMCTYYKTRALGGYGLEIIEVTAVDPRGKAILNEIGLWDDAQIPMFAKLMDAIHEGGAKVVVQLHHAGRQTANPYIFDETPEAPSRVPCPLLQVPVVEMTSERVWELIGQFGDAALRAKRAGADGVEVHGAHGYLVAQFMSPQANKRTDEFGGSFLGRTKFAREIFADIRRKCGEDFTLLFRFGHDEKVPGGRTLEESVSVARMVEEAGVDCLDISIMTYQSLPYMSAPPALPHGFNMFPTREIKNSVSIPVISVGRYTPEIAENALQSGCADFIAFGRESLCDPEIPNKVAEGRLDEICPCIGCTQSCLGYLNAGGVASCLINPVTGHEAEYDLGPAEHPKKVLVAGAGPAGLMAAMTAARKGHEVVLAEKTDRIGGQFRLAAVAPTKQDIATAIKYYGTMCEKLGVDIRLGTEVTEDLVRELAPDAAVLATGGLPLRPGIPGLDGSGAVDAIDVLDGRIFPGPRVLIVGGGMTGVETADYLAEANHDVTIIEMKSDIALDEAAAPRYFLIPRLREYGVKWEINATVKRFVAGGVIYEQDGVEKALGGFDTVILALGVCSYNPLEEAVRGLVDEVYVIGDAEQPAPANRATETGLAAALAL